jgi:hypothetical protein
MREFYRIPTGFPYNRNSAAFSCNWWLPIFGEAARLVWRLV